MRSIVLMPLKKNIPKPRHEWSLTRCPKCGAECWTDKGRDNVAKMMGALLMCTECALKAR